MKKFYFPVYFNEICQYCIQVQISNQTSNLGSKTYLRKLDFLEKRKKLNSIVK